MEEREGTVGAKSEEEVMNGVEAETRQREAAKERRREDLQGRRGLNAEVMEKRELGVRRGGERNARLVDELAETAVGAAKEDASRGSANEVQHREALNGSDGAHGDDGRLGVVTRVNGQEKDVRRGYNNERVDDSDIEDARFQLHAVDELNIPVDSVIGEPRIIGGVVPEEEAISRGDIDQVKVLQIP